MNAVTKIMINANVCGCLEIPYFLTFQKHKDESLDWI